MIIPPQIRLYAELGALAILVGAFLWYTHHERMIGEQKIIAADQDAVIRQKAIDDRVLADARSVYDKEKAAVDQGYLATPTVPPGKRVCYYTPGKVSAPSLQPSGSTTPAIVVPADPSLHPDLGEAFRLLSLVGDRLSASARQLNSETHP